MYPTVNLEPGSTGADVQKLQNYLVSQGYMTQAEVNTGPGIYGPRTTAAVRALQSKLGVDNSTGPGYWGPRTLAAVQKIGTGTSGGTKVLTQAELDAQNKAKGISQFNIGPAQVGGAVGSGTPGQPPIDGQSPDDQNAALAQILQNPNLTADQRTAIQSIYGAVKEGDAAKAQQIGAAMTAASQYSDPYFKAQTRLATDALSRGLSSKSGDLAFAESQKMAALDDLRKKTSSSKDQLSFAHQQELTQLGRKYENDLNVTRENMAASGFASSSRRARAEQILGDQNTGLVESSNKTYGYQTGNLDRSLASADASTQAEIANLRRLTSEGKIDLLRGAEQTVGSKGLVDLGYGDLLGDVGGTIPAAKAKDQLAFAGNFVF